MIAKPCRICGGTEHELVCDRIRGGIQCRVMRCTSCGVAVLEDRFFTPEELAKQYSTTYAFSPSQGSLIGTEWSSYGHYLRRIADRLDPATTRLMEIGAGPGHFVGMVKDKVKEVVAVELNASQADHCRRTHGVTVHDRPIEDLSYGAEFDVVCMFSVLEHIPDPHAFLRKAMEFVRPGGVLFIEVPNIADPLLAVYDVPSYAESYFRPVHLFNFGRTSLSALLTGAGFAKYAIDTGQCYSLGNHLHWAANGKGQASTEIGYRFSVPAPIIGGPELTRELQEFFDRMDRDYRALLHRHDFGDMLFAFVEKPGDGDGR